MSRTTARLLWPERNMPAEAARALANFTAANRSYVGAGWADCLDALLDSDTHLDVTEAMHDEVQGYQCSECDAIYATLDAAAQCHWGIGGVDEVPMPVTSEVAVTLLYATGQPPTVDEVRSALAAAAGDTAIDA